MKYAALIPLLLVAQDLRDLPEPAQKTARHELGDTPQLKAIQKEPDGSFTIDTRTTSLHVAATGDLISKDEQIALDKMPKAAQDTVRKEFAGKRADTRRVTKVSFEAQVGNLKLKIDEAGSILRREDTVKASELPAAVSKAAVAKVPGSAVSKAKKILEDGHIRYKVTVESPDKKKVEASFNEDGSEIK
ncbi:MAG TPA: hypothetical protein VI643_05200 [Planctomycetota bacterium]|nr:hypothetical protein [Planctomycetota bacterium]